jgi:DNA-binding NtrC family response regulator
MLAETADDSIEVSGSGAPPRPGVIVAFSGAAPMSLVLPLGDEPMAIGRAEHDDSILPDHRLSRAHCTVALSPAGWVVRDLGSRNGTFVDGEPVHGERVFPSPAVIRAASTILLPRRDVTSFRAPLTEDGLVLGWRMQEALAAVERAASQNTLLLSGESGTGKELAAHRFHERGPHSRGPFVAVNCAAIPEGLAERLLFGARKGAFSGADADVTGYVSAADGGVLFLDEGGELDLQVQAKLLRVLETHEVLALGATQPSRVTLRVCVATHVELRRAVAEGRFRADLYHRLAPPEVALPPLRHRLDEMAYHVAAEASVAGAPSPHARLIEACMLRPWPGNVRELRRQIHDAASRAVAEKADQVRAEHLAPTAGQSLGASSPRPEPRGATVAPSGGPITREVVEQALREHSGNVSRAARSLGIQRTQLYREMDRYGLESRGKRH